MIYWLDEKHFEKNLPEKVLDSNQTSQCKTERLYSIECSYFDSVAKFIHPLAVISYFLNKYPKSLTFIYLFLVVQVYKLYPNRPFVPMIPLVPIIPFVPMIPFWPTNPLVPIIPLVPMIFPFWPTKPLVPIIPLKPYPLEVINPFVVIG